MSTVYEKVLKYLEEHKTPTPAAKMAKYYILSESSINAALRTLIQENKVTYRKHGSTRFYQIR